MTANITLSRETAGASAGLRHERRDGFYDVMFGRGNYVSGDIGT